MMMMMIDDSFILHSFVMSEVIIIFLILLLLCSKDDCRSLALDSKAIFIFLSKNRNEQGLRVSTCKQGLPISTLSLHTCGAIHP